MVLDTGDYIVLVIVCMVAILSDYRFDQFRKEFNARIVEIWREINK